MARLNWYPIDRKCFLAFEILDNVGFNPNKWLIALALSIRSMTVGSNALIDLAVESAMARRKPFRDWRLHVVVFGESFLCRLSSRTNPVA